jgi:hypothetical protein
MGAEELLAIADHGRFLRIHRGQRLFIPQGIHQG